MTPIVSSDTYRMGWGRGRDVRVELSEREGTTREVRLGRPEKRQKSLEGVQVKVPDRVRTL